MRKKLVLALGCSALLTMFATAALADAITFSYSVTTGTAVTEANKTGSPSLTGGPVGGLVTVKDTNTNLTLFLPTGSTGMIDSDTNMSYFEAFGLLLEATYMGSGALQVQVLSSYCPGGICLQGSNNFGTYTALNGGGGAWGGVFIVGYVSPAILAFFGDSTDIVDPYGGDAFTTHHNSFGNSGTTDSAQFGSGTITIQTTPVPEPTTLALLGTGVLGLAGLIRRK